MTEALVHTEALARHHRLGAETVHALRGVDLRLAAGEHVAITGPSGAGKSTLLHLLGLLDRPSAGSYRYAGRETAQMTGRERARLRGGELGVVFQSFHLLSDEPAVDNVGLPLLYAGVPRRERRQRAAEALERVGLAERLTHRPGQLSGGERQRVAIARAVVKRPRLLLADEPTGNLDSDTGRGILDLFDTLHDDGLTLLVITHDPAVADRAERALRLADGRIEG